MKFSELFTASNNFHNYHRECKSLDNGSYGPATIQDCGTFLLNLTWSPRNCVLVAAPIAWTPLLHQTYVSNIWCQLFTTAEFSHTFLRSITSWGADLGHGKEDNILLVFPRQGIIFRGKKKSNISHFSLHLPGCCQFNFIKAANLLVR